MYVTFMIGNGLDIGLGLKTRYINFYPYFLNKANENNFIRQQLEKESTEAYKTWADLEKKLGEITAEVNGEAEEQIKQFLEDLLDMEDCLAEYLEVEQSVFVADEELRKKKMINAIRQIKESSIESEQELVKRVYSMHEQEDCSYCAISFNYTDCLDKLWSAVEGVEIASRTVMGNRYIEKIETLLHIHGSLAENAMIFGVNDLSQIANECLREHRVVKRAMIKPQLNEEYGQNKIKKAKQVIDVSSIVCLYGLSIGETDRMWWEYLGNWLVKSNNRILIIHNYAPGIPKQNLVRTLNSKENVKLHFLNQTKLQKDVQQEVMKRIIVKNNIDIFDAN